MILIMEEKNSGKGLRSKPVLNDPDAADENRNIFSIDCGPWINWTTPLGEFVSTSDNKRHVEHL